MRRVYVSADHARPFTTYHNPHDRPLVFSLGGDGVGPDLGRQYTKRLEPGEELELDSGYDANIRMISPHLRRGPRPEHFEPEPFPVEPVPELEQRAPAAHGPQVQTVITRPAPAQRAAQATARASAERQQAARAMARHLLDG